MDLYVLRHGVAEERGAGYSNDGERPLTAKGVRRMTRQVRGLRALGVSIGVVVTSPLVRAVQTAEIVTRGSAGDRPAGHIQCPRPRGSPSQLISSLATGYSTTDGVMVVGHEPDLSSLVSVLTTGDPSPSCGSERVPCASCGCRRPGTVDADGSSGR